MAAAKSLDTPPPTLLARKGEGRPAMRSQFLAPPPERHALEDLGWNDFRAGEREPVAALTEATPENITIPALPGKVAAQLAAAAASLKWRPESSGQASDPGYVKFWLRLDRERYQRLRAACAVSKRSGQSLVTEALDNLLTRFTQ
jgi:hypothetical protein